jgi:hypothetical protein
VVGKVGVTGQIPTVAAPPWMDAQSPPCLSRVLDFRSPTSPILPALMAPLFPFPHQTPRSNDAHDGCLTPTGTAYRSAHLYRVFPVTSYQSKPIPGRTDIDQARVVSSLLHPAHQISSYRLRHRNEKSPCYAWYPAQHRSRPCELATAQELQLSMSLRLNRLLSLVPRKRRRRDLRIQRLLRPQRPLRLDTHRHLA